MSGFPSSSFPSSSSSSSSSSSLSPFGTQNDWCTWTANDYSERILHYLNAKMTQNNRNIRCKEEFDSLVRPMLRDDALMDDFYIFVVPPISLAEYIKRLIQYTRISISPVNLAIALFYMERLERSQMIDVNPFSIFRLLSTAYLIAFKTTEDPPVMKNGEYSRIAGTEQRTLFLCFLYLSILSSSSISFIRLFLILLFFLNTTSILLLFPLFFFLLINLTLFHKSYV